MNGSHSGVALVVFLVVLGLRFMATQRRRSPGRPRTPSGSRGFTAAPGRPTQGEAVTPVSGDGPSTGTGFGGTAPGWFRDPFVRHDQRYWSGAAWTEHVLDDGVPGVDPPPPPRGPAA